MATMECLVASVELAREIEIVICTRRMNIEAISISKMTSANSGAPRVVDIKDKEVGRLPLLEAIKKIIMVSEIIA